ncbi:hypothetical protein [Paenibacillus validus]|uniref:hypothetical protein n=1 Tax=Paenibacillus validus TaxID=44253 RepID=UPI00399C9A6E
MKCISCQAIFSQNGSTWGLAMANIKQIARTAGVSVTTVPAAAARSRHRPHGPSRNTRASYRLMERRTV